MKKMKITIVTGMLAASAFSLTGCITTMPMGMPGMMPGGMPASGTGLPTTSASGVPSSSSGQSSRADEEFAENIKKLQIGQTTKEDTLVLLGNPSSRHAMQNNDVWSYDLGKTEHPLSGKAKGLVSVYFSNSKVVFVEIMRYKLSLSTGMETDIIYSKGTRP
jgi:hypothetical protein